jgi:hypothetical protein
LKELQEQLEALEKEGSQLDKDIEGSIQQMDEFKRNKNNRELMYLTQRDISLLLDLE